MVGPKTPAACGPIGRFDFGEIAERYEPGCLAALGPLAKRDGAELTLALANGKTKAFKNEGGKPAWDSHDTQIVSYDKSYSLVAYDPAAPAFVIQAADGGLVGIDARDGHETSFGVDFPHFAPGGVFAMTIADEGTGAVTLRDVSASPAKVVWESKPGHPLNRRFLAWDGNRRARLLIEDSSIAFVVRDAAGKWSYDTIAMDEPVIDDPPTCMQTPGKKTEDDLSACLAKLGDMAVVNGTLLSLRLEDGTRKRFVADPREGWTTYTTYQLEGYNPRDHVYVVHTGYYEGTGNMMLVDSRTGEETDLGDGAQAPFFSPDGRYFIYVLSGDQENNGAGTELHVYEWGPKPKEIWTTAISDETYQIESMTGWDGDKRFGLQLVDGRTASVSQDDKGAWHYEVALKAKPKPDDRPSSHAEPVSGKGDKK